MAWKRINVHLSYSKGIRNAKIAAGSEDTATVRMLKVGCNYGRDDVAVPRDQQDRSLPMMVPNGSRWLTDVNDTIVSLYVGDILVRDIQHHVATGVQVDISHETNSSLIDAMLDEIMMWKPADRRGAPNHIF